MEDDPHLHDIENIKQQLINESQQCKYPYTKQAIKFRYRNTAYDLYRKWRDLGIHPTNFLTFGTRRSSTVSNYGNTPIFMRRSISSNGDLPPFQSGGSLRGAPGGLLEQESKYGSQFGSLRGLPTDKRLSKFDESEEMEGGNKKDLLLNREYDAQSNDSWDTASLNVAVTSARSNKKSGGRAVVPDSTDNWQEVKSKQLNKNIEKVKQGDVNRSTESLVSVKKKKSWWFKRKKPLKEVKSSEGESEFENVCIADKASSELNLVNQPTEDMSTSYGELRKSQILLKGYSQRTVAGMNLSSRSSVANHSVTSRVSLPGSDILMTDSSKSFMQYDLSTRDNRSKEDNKDKSYEEQFENNLGSGSLDDQIENRDDHENVRSQNDSDSSCQMNCEAVYTPNDKLPLVDVDSTFIKKDESIPAHSSSHDSQHLPLSPDSRPIRPLHCSTSVPIPTSSTSPPLLRHSYSKPSSSQESYPHSLMDRPISTRQAKRLSNEQQQIFDADSVPVKKSNIAYTLTFQNEPICVNLRTKSQSVTPEPFLDDDSKIVKNSNDSPGRNCDRQLSLPNERETSPGYRLAFDGKISAKKSPSTPKKILGNNKKNPKVTREKDKFTLNNKNSFSNDDIIDYLSSQSSPTDADEYGSSEINLDKNNDDIEVYDNMTSKIEVKMEKEIKIVHNIQAINKDGENNGSAEDTNCDDVEGENIKPVSKLQRRNTFTLSSKKEKKSDGENEEVNNGETSNANSQSNGEILKLVMDGSIEQNVTISVCHSPTEEYSAEQVSRTTSNGNPKVTPAAKSRIPMKRGRQGGDSSRIPTISSPSTNIPTPTSRNQSSSIKTQPSHINSSDHKPSQSFIKSPPTNAHSSPSSSQLNSPSASRSQKSFLKSPERSSLKMKRSGIPSARKPSLDETVVNKFSSKCSSQDNFMRVDNNAIVVKRETIIELKTEAMSKICSVM